MNGWFNPDSWMDILDHLLLVIGALSVAIIPSWMSVRNGRAIRVVKDQVVNGHTEPMRADLDRISNVLDKTSMLVENVQHSLDGFRSELSEEEGRRRDNDRELREEIARARGEARRNIKNLRADVNSKLDHLSEMIDGED